MLKVMSAKDKFHDIVRLALEKDGWNITSDPLYPSSVTFRKILLFYNLKSIVYKAIAALFTNIKSGHIN